MYHRRFLTIGISGTCVLLCVHSVLSVTTLSPEEMELEENRILQRHNLYRECHDAPPLEMDLQLHAVAQEEANTLAGNKTRKHMKMQNTYDGFNIFVKPPTPQAGVYAVTEEDMNPVDMWYQEGRFYQPGDISFAADHFTQLVWKSTKKLGVGIAESEDGILYVVCKYDPVGNVDGQYEENVQPVNTKASVFQEGICLPPDLFTKPMKEDLHEMTTPFIPSINATINETINDVSKAINTTIQLGKHNQTATDEKSPERAETALYYVIILSIFSMIVTTCLAISVIFTLYKVLKCNPCKDGKGQSTTPVSQRYINSATGQTRDSPRQEAQQESLSTSYNCSSYM